MSRVIVTGSIGAAFDEILAINLPVLFAYARKHNIALSVVRLDGPRPPSWQKVSALIGVLRHHTAAVWIDADVVITNGNEDIFAAVPDDKWQGVVEHTTNCGTVPNCGVWVCRPQLTPFLQKAWARTRYVHHGWWEQADIMEQMGYTFAGSNNARHVTPTELYNNTHFLPATWNHHPCDNNRVAAPNFTHVTQYDDRLATIKERVAFAFDNWIK